MPARRAGRAHRAVTAHGTDTVARPSASSRGTRCGGTGGVSSSRRRGRRRAQPRGRTLTGWAGWEEGRRGDASQRRGCSRDFDGAGGSPTAPRGKREGEAGSNLRKTRLSTVSPPERRTTATADQIPARGRGLGAWDPSNKLAGGRGS
jgi:hypothetical protein